MVRDHPDYLSLKLQKQKSWTDTDFQTPVLEKSDFYQPYVTLLGKEGAGDPETQAVTPA